MIDPIAARPSGRCQTRKPSRWTEGRACRALLPALLLLILGVFNPARLAAAPATADQAARLVRQWLAQNQSAPLGARLSRVIGRVATYPDSGGEPDYYIVELNPQGFVIVSADDMVEPIVGFSPAGRFDPTPASPLGALVSRDLPGRAARVRRGRAATAGKGQAFTPGAEELHAQRKWSALAPAATTPSATAGKISAVTDVRVAPLLRSKWDQATTANNQACYNYYTPPGNAGSATNYPAGCVATATAQLMRYYQYPTAGVGTKSFPITINGGKASRKLRGGNGAGGPYNWSAMPLTPDTTTMSAAQYQMIGALTADVGSAVSMAYTKSSSAALLMDAGTRLLDTFQYSNVIDGYADGASIDKANLYKMINPNLDAGYPVLLGIQRGLTAGHAIVCDGYGYDSTTLYHHLNLGWSGYDDAWYNLPTIDTSAITFNAITEILFNIYVSGSGEMVSGRVTDSNGVPLAGVRISAYQNGGGVFTATTNAKGIYALKKLPSFSSFSVMAQQGDKIFTPQALYTGLSSDNVADNGNVWGFDFKAAPGRNAARAWRRYE